ALLLCGCAASPAVVPFHYDNGPDYVREGLYRIVDDRGRMGYADESGRVVIAPRFAFALPFEGGKAKVTDTGQRKEVPGSGGEHWYWESDAWYFIDTMGRKTDDPQARDATPLP
ncbi:WG repeat-containing protein, partial [Desulfovibrio sp.]